MGLRSLAPLVSLRRHPGLPFEELAEERDVGEVQFVGYLVNQFVAILEHYFGFEDDRIVDPIHHRAAAHLLDHAVQIARSQVQSVGIKGDVPFALGILGYF